MPISLQRMTRNKRLLLAQMIGAGNFCTCFFILGIDEWTLLPYNTVLLAHT